VGIQGETIVGVGDLEAAEAACSIDATGRYVTPGFIDIHTHSDLVVFVNPRMESKVRQGVTTEVVGNCGEGYAPLTPMSVETARGEMARYGKELAWRSMGEYLAAVEKSGTATNIAAFVGHGILRESVMGYEMRPPTPGEMDAMKRLLIQGMEEGAVGYTSGRTP
jgi:N-acyl-D-amino-acid deacylase